MQIRWGNMVKKGVIALLFIAIGNGVVMAAQTAKLTIVVEPAEVADEAYWKLSHGLYDGWFPSSRSIWSAPVGKNQLQFSPVPGWCTPPTQTVDIQSGENVAYVEYTRNSCDIPEDFRNIECEEFLKKDIFTNKEVVYAFQSECNIVKSIRIRGLRNLDMVPFKVDMLKSVSTTVDQDPPHIIYKNFNVASENYAFEHNLDIVSITFSVEKSWIEENGIIPDSINIYGFSDGIWNEIPNEKVEEDAAHIYFTASPITEYVGTMAVSGQRNIKPGLDSEMSGDPELNLEPPKKLTGLSMEQVSGFQLLSGILVIFVIYAISRKM